MLNLNEYSQSVRQERRDNARVSSKELPRPGPFSRRFSHLSVSWYNNPLIKYKVTLEMLTQKFTP